MNKNDKKKISHAINLLEHAAGSVKAILESDLHESGISLLTNMQQMTIEIGNILEEKEKNCSLLIKKLETLCETYYQCSITKNNVREMEQQCSCMKKLITQLKEDIKKIPAKTEILFLPYQVSMWDSLESIWRAAKEDNQTDCYVVPLPVYDVMPDNSLGELHYDGTLYPDDVPVTSYLEYDIEKRHPDIIFFHNPYDDINTVTRVPEQYYSRNLKKYTNLLVYIPYYLTSNGGPADHQCYTPGILFADYAVIQPGIIYEKFCRVYTNFLRQNGLEQTLPKAKDKFLPFGSPKIDKLFQTKYALTDLPKQWQTAIRKKDGSFKKIVLYNLSITSLLETNEKMLKKIDAVLALFREMQDELTLLWRPHPLLKKTIEAMRPQLRNAYEKIIQQYQEEDWGIFDETPDSNLAMIFSDAYYGDYSSLIISYQALNKPILLQNVNSSLFPLDGRKMQLWFFRQPALINGVLWFVSQDRNGLYCFPLPTGQHCKMNIHSISKAKSETTAMLAATFENEPCLQEALYGDIIQYGDLLIFPPFRAKTIATYHMKTKQIHSYALPEQIANIGKGKYHTGFVYGNSVYLIGIYSDIELLRLNMDTGKAELCGCIPDRAARMDLAETVGYCTLSQHKIFIPLASAHAIVEYDLKSKKTKLNTLPKKYTGQLKGVFHYKEDSCLLLIGTIIVCWHPGNNDFTTITEYPNTELDRILVAGKQLYLLGLRNQIVYVYDLKSSEKNTINCILGAEKRGISGRTKLLPIDYSKDSLILFSLFHNKIIYIQDGQIQNTIELFTTDIPDINYDEVFCQHIKTEGQFFHCSLEHYLNYVISRKDDKKPNAYENVGRKIYRTLAGFVEQ